MVPTSPGRFGPYARPIVRNPFSSPLWQNQAFVRVWAAATISIFGSLITRMALPFVAILVLGAGAFEVALVRSIDLLAALLFGLIVGAWVDRLRRRPVMVGAPLSTLRTKTQPGRYPSVTERRRVD